MKVIPTMALVVAILASNPLLSAGCLSAFNQDLYVCSSTMGGFTEIGCNMDALVDYYGCVLAAATT